MVKWDKMKVIEEDGDSSDGTTRDVFTVPSNKVWNLVGFEFISSAGNISKVLVKDKQGHTCGVYNTAATEVVSLEDCSFPTTLRMEEGDCLSVQTAVSTKVSTKKCVVYERYERYRS